MANLKEVRIRITSVSSTQQITKAMKMVSAAKLRRAQDAIVQMRPYATKLKEILQNLSQSLSSSDGGAFTKVRAENKILIIAVTSNRGLAGAFNSTIIKEVSHLIRNTYSKQAKEGNVKVLSIGKKAGDFFAKSPQVCLGSENQLFANLNFANTSVIAERVMKEFSEEKWDKVIVVYNQFKNAAVQILQTEQLLPIVPQTTTEKTKAVDYVLEPGKEEIVRDLIPTSVKTQLYKAVLDSHASEHGARMTAMNKATDNAGELIKSLKLQYNKARQAAITNEILEIVAGAEALKG